MKRNSSKKSHKKIKTSPVIMDNESKTTRKSTISRVDSHAKIEKSHSKIKKSILKNEVNNDSK